MKVESESILRMSCGREFQRWGAEWLKALDPMVVRRAEGTVSWKAEEDRRAREGV